MSTSNKTLCPAAALAEEVQRLINALGVIDQKAVTSVITDPDDGAAYEDIQTRLNAAVDWSSHLQASSAKGALYQVLCMADLTTLLVGYVRGDENADASKTASAIRRLAHSVAAYIESSNDGVMLEDVGGSYYLNRIHSPHRRIEYALRAS